MFLLNGNPLPRDTPFTAEVSIQVVIPPVVELINDIETITNAGETIERIEKIQYPANWLRLSTLEEKQAIGITEVADPVAYDDRFYWGVDNPKLLDDREESNVEGKPLYVQVLGTVDGKPAMVDSTERLVTKGLKTNWVAQIKDTAGKLLSATDWMIIRKAERGTAIPADVVAYRAAVVAECNRLETAINNAKTMEAFITVVMNQNWEVSK